MSNQATKISSNVEAIQTVEIPKEKWTDFLSDLSRRRFGWKSKVEILDGAIGSQILSDGLILNGITHEEKSGIDTIEISLGESTDRHQSHTISNPLTICYFSEPASHRGVLEIVDGHSVKTLVSLLEPMPIYSGYTAFEIVSTA